MTPADVADDPSCFALSPVLVWEFAVASLPGCPREPGFVMARSICGVIALVVVAVVTGSHVAALWYVAVFDVARVASLPSDP